MPMIGGSGIIDANKFGKRKCHREYRGGVEQTTERITEMIVVPNRIA